MSEERKKILDNIAFSLEGTCDDLYEVAAEYGLEDLSLDDRLYIGEQVFQCEDCGWWFGITEMSEMDDVCAGCYEDWEELEEEENEDD